MGPKMIALISEKIKIEVNTNQFANDNSFEIRIPLRAQIFNTGFLSLNSSEYIVSK